MTRRSVPNFTSGDGKRRRAFRPLGRRCFENRGSGAQPDPVGRMARPGQPVLQQLECVTDRLSDDVKINRPSIILPPPGPLLMGGDELIIS